MKADTTPSSRVVFVPPALAAHLQARLQQGLALHQQGRHPEARAVYEGILQLHPDHVDALHLAGVLAFQTDRAAEAVALIDRAISLQPRQAAFHSNLGLAQVQLGQLAAAIASYDQAIALKPDFAEAHLNRGHALRQLQQPDAALASYDRAIALRAHDAESHFGRALVLAELQQREPALAAYDQAIALRPGHAESHYNRGNVLRELKRLDEALASYDQALAIRPQYARALVNRGVTLYQQNHLEAALASYDQALRIRPGYADAHVNRGISLFELGQLDAAVASYDQALALQPDYPEAQINKSLVLLLQGDFRQGWELYESRWRVPASLPYRPAFSQPRWNGSEPLAGKTLLLFGEQGFGDFLQFSRYANLLAARGAQVLLQVPVSLAALLKDLPGISRIVVKGDPLPPFDWYCPLLSLPQAFHTDLQTIPSGERYLRADARKVEVWRGKLDDRSGDRTRLRVGLAWSGNPAHENDRHRSILLSALLQHLPVHHQYVSLQKEVRPADALVLERHSHILHFGGQLQDFSDTAALCELMDVVISVDTSVAHLSGALGKRTWVMLPLVPDWRWLLGRDDSPWYPSVRLYRQTRRNDWRAVFSRLWTDLKQLQA